MQQGHIRIKLTLAPVCCPLRKRSGADERADGNRADPQRGGNLFVREALVMQRKHLTVVRIAFGTVVLHFFRAPRREHRHGPCRGRLLQQVTAGHLGRGLFKTRVLPGQEALDRLA
jgi:hypothetical protein